MRCIALPRLVRLRPPPAFANNGVIPKQYSCEGTDISPLQWSGAPHGTKSFALIIDDPDAPDPRAPKMTWVHWVVYNIPADVHGLPEGAAKSGLPPGAKQGLNDWKRPGYGGPCPPTPASTINAELSRSRVTTSFAAASLPAIG